MRIRHLREAQGLTMDQLASAVDISKTQLQRTETEDWLGDKAHQFVKMSDKLGVSLDFLLRGVEINDSIKHKDEIGSIMTEFAKKFSYKRVEALKKLIDTWD